jgi:hypothetical protein
MITDTTDQLTSRWALLMVRHDGVSLVTDATHLTIRGTRGNIRHLCAVRMKCYGGLARTYAQTSTVRNVDVVTVTDSVGLISR